MTSRAYFRKKEPERVRQALLDSAASLVVELGNANVTVAAVAAGAGVTKGALFHHFADREALIVGMFDDLLERLDSQIVALMAADPVAHGRFTRAYVNAALSTSDEDRRIWVALIGSLVGTPAHIVRWYEWMDRCLSMYGADDDHTLQMVRLAADGAWLAVTTRLSAMDMGRLRGHLLALTVPTD